MRKLIFSLSTFAATFIFTTNVFAIPLTQTGDWSNFPTTSPGPYSETHVVKNTGRTASVDVASFLPAFPQAEIITPRTPLGTISPAIFTVGTLNAIQITPNDSAPTMPVQATFMFMPKLTVGNLFYVGGLYGNAAGASTDVYIQMYSGGVNVTDSLSFFTEPLTSGPNNKDVMYSLIGAGPAATGLISRDFTVDGAGQSEFIFFSNGAGIDKVLITIAGIANPSGGGDNVFFGIATPEPETYMLMGTALVAIMFLARRKRAQNTA